MDICVTAALATLEIIVKLVSCLPTYNLHFFSIMRHVVASKKSNSKQRLVNLR